MRAAAQLTVASAPDSGRTRITRLRSDAPFVLRPTMSSRPAATSPWCRGGDRAVHVSLASGAAGPVGGDNLQLGIDVQAGAILVLRNVSATIALPGPHGDSSRTDVTVNVSANGTLVWLPGPLIAARGCRHRETVRMHLEPGARVLLREELLLGRHGEDPGTVQRRLRVCLGDQPLLDQELRIGLDGPGWTGAAVTGEHTALGSLLLVDPAWETELARRISRVVDPTTAIMPLVGPAVLVTSLARDSLALRRQLDAAQEWVMSAAASGVADPAEGY